MQSTSALLFRNNYYNSVVGNEFYSKFDAILENFSTRFGFHLAQDL